MVYHTHYVGTQFNQLVLSQNMKNPPLAQSSQAFPQNLARNLTKRFCLVPLCAVMLTSALVGCEAKVTTSTSSATPESSSSTPKSADSPKADAPKADAPKSDGAKSDNTKSVEKAVSGALASFLEKETIKSPVESINCPNVDPVTAGKVIDCEATIKEGKFPVAVTFKDDAGQLNVAPKRLIPLSKVEEAIKGNIKQTSNAEATVDCGGSVWVIQKVGENFTCKATAPDGKTLNVKITVKDETGKIEMSNES
jgi:hypothetical protein